MSALSVIVLAGALATLCAPQAVRFEPDVRYGAADEDDPAFLYMPASVVADSAGRVFVLDHAEQSILEFAADGDYVRTFSRSGEGPGELRSAFRLAVSPTDGIVVHDPGNRRISFFDGSGRFRRSADMSSMGHAFVPDFEVAGGDEIYMETRTIDWTGERGETTVTLARFSPDLETRKVLDELQIEENVYITRPVRTNVPLPFPPWPYWAVTPSGEVVVGHSGDYTLRFFSARGDLLRTVRHEGTRQKVTDEDRERHFAGITTTTGGHVSQGAPAYMRKVTEFPEYKPYFKGLTVDDEGNVLVLTYETSEDRSVWDVFDADGRFRCRTELPSFYYQSFVRGGYLYHISIDDDEAFVQRYHRIAVAEDRP